MVRKSSDGNGRAKNSRAKKRTIAEENNSPAQGDSGQGSLAGNDRDGAIHSGNEAKTSPQLAPFTFPEQTTVSAGITRVLLKKAFFDSIEAVKACQGIPDDDMARVVRGALPPELVPSMAEMYSKLDQLDRAQLFVGYCYAFHIGYSQRIADEAAKTNLHMEYVNEQKSNGAAAPAAPSTGPNNG